MTRTLVRAALALSLLAPLGCGDDDLIGPGNPGAVQITGERVQQQPATPTVTATATPGTITVAGDFHAECDLGSRFVATVARHGDEIDLSVRYDHTSACSGVASPMRYTAVVSGVPAGTYTLDVYHLNDLRQFTPGARVSRVQVVVP